MKFHPNMSIPETIKKAEEIGCDVNSKHRTGEITFTHPNIEKPYTISASKDTIGKGFLSWIKPALRKNEVAMEKPSFYTESFQWAVARAVATKTRENKTSTTESIKQFLEKEGHTGITRKKISDRFSHLYSKKLVYREDAGHYVASDMLINLVFGQEEQAMPEEETQAESELEFEPDIEDESEETKENEDTKDVFSKLDYIAYKLDSMVDRLDKASQKLEYLVNKLEVSQDAKEVLEMLEEVMHRRKSNG